jgi:hypothetical protein
MLTVNKCLGTDAGEVCQERNRCRQEGRGSREPVAHETRNKRSQKDAQGVSDRRNITAFGRTLEIWSGAALEVLSQDGWPAVEKSWGRAWVTDECRFCAL